MNPFGDGSNGALNVTSGTTNLLLNTKYQFTTVNVAAGATLSTNSTTGAVLYICATESITIDGTINVSNKVNNGNNTWSVTIDSVTYTSPGVAAGGGGGGTSLRAQSNGFGGGGDGGWTNSSSPVPTTTGKGGNGATGSASFGTQGSGGNTRFTAPSTMHQASGGNATPGSAGGGGGGWGYYTRTGSYIGQLNFGGGSGGWQYGGNGIPGDGSFSYISGAGGATYYYFAGGGGGAGGRAGRAGVHVVLKAPSITINGSVITSGTAGQKGGNGGADAKSGGTTFGGKGGGGGGGGNAGNAYYFYGTSESINPGSTTLSGGTGGGAGLDGSGLSSGIAGVDGSNGTISAVQLAPYPQFTANVTSGTRPLTVNFTNQSLGATSYTWNFGDSSGSSQVNPSHTYTSTGTFTVTLTATNPAGSNIETKTAYITVSIATFQREAKGTLLFGGSVARGSVAFKREAKGGLVFSGDARHVILKDVEAIEEKRYLYKVYDEDGNFIEVWRDVISEPMFTQEINQLGSEMDIELARNSDSLGVSTSPLLTEDGQPITTEDDFPLLASTQSRNQVGPGSSVLHNNRVDVWVYYGSIEPLLTESGEPILTEDDEEILATIGAPNGRRIFTGFISEINSRYGETETTSVKLLSYGWDLEQYPITTVDDETTVPFFTQDPSQIARSALDRFETVSNAEQVTYTTYTDTSISNTGTNVTYTFRNNTYGEVLRKVIELMPSNWYFYIGLGDNVVYYRQRTVEPRHVFYLGKHIKALDLKSSIHDATNRVIITGGGTPILYREYTEAPAPNTRRALEQYVDGRLTDPTSADIIGDGINEQNNKIKYRSSIEILTKQYDIESIEVGDVIGFRNFGNYVDNLTMMVVGRTYTPDYVQLQLETKPPTVNKRLEDLKRNLAVAENQDIPDSPTS